MSDKIYNANLASMKSRTADEFLSVIQELLEAAGYKDLNFGTLQKRGAEYFHPQTGVRVLSLDSKAAKIKDGETYNAQDIVSVFRANQSLAARAVFDKLAFSQVGPGAKPEPHIVQILTEVTEYDVPTRQRVHDKIGVRRMFAERERERTLERRRGRQLKQAPVGCGSVTAQTARRKTTPDISGFFNTNVRQSRVKSHHTYGILLPSAVAEQSYHFARTERVKQERFYHNSGDCTVITPSDGRAFSVVRYSAANLVIQRASADHHGAAYRLVKFDASSVFENARRKGWQKEGRGSRALIEDAIVERELMEFDLIG